MLYRLVIEFVLSRMLSILRVSLALSVLSANASAAVPSPTKTQPAPDNIYLKRIFAGHDIAVRAVAGIIEDNQGIMWFGTERGLFRYDGYELRQFGHLDTLYPITHITTLHIPENSNDLWIGGYDRLIKFNLTDYSFVIHTKNAPNGIALDNYFVTNISSTPNGDIILATGSGIAIIHHEDQRLTKHSPLVDGDSVDDKLVWTTFFDVATDQLWLGTNHGVRVMDWHSRIMERPTFSENEIDQSIIHDMLIDQYGELWFGSSEGLYHVSVDKTSIKKYMHNAKNVNSLGANLVWSLFQDNLGNIWVGTDHGGLNVYDRTRGQFNRFLHSSGQETSISSNTVKAITQDKNGNLWSGHFPTGVSFFSPQNSAVTSISHDERVKNGLSNNSVLALMEDANQNVWIGTDGGGLNVFDPHSGKFSQYRHDPTDQKSLSSDVILSLLQDKQGNIWVGTYREGLLRYDDKTNKFERLFPQLKKEDGSSIAVWSMVQTKDDKIWFGTQDEGAFRYDLTNDELVNFKESSDKTAGVAADFVFAIKQDSEDNLWFGTRGGVSLLKPGETEFIHLLHEPENTESLQDEVVFSVFEDSEGQLWFGTRGGLSLLDKETLTFRTFNESHGLSSKSIRSIQEDNDKNLWLGTDQGISKFNLETYAVQNHRTDIGWLPGPYNNNAVVKNKKSSILFGGINGLLMLDPSLYRLNTAAPNVVLTDFKLFTQSILPGKNEGLLNKGINFTDSLYLHHNQAMFSIEFAALDYAAPEKNRYAYKLEGFDKTWNQIGNRRNAVYTNIDPGRYVFKVRASNSNGIWNDDGTTLRIVQLAAPWQTWWAYLGYLAIIVCLLLWFIQQKTQKLEFERNLEAKSNRKLRHLDKLKSNFLATTSHELLTPLNGIIGLSQLLETRLKDVDSEAHQKAQMINASGMHLSGLVRDILDFTLVSDNKLILSIEPVNLYEAVESCVKILTPLSQEKSLSIINNIADKSLHVNADRHRLRHILENLISNGIKYTDKGQVKVSCNVMQDEVKILIEDTGKGISTEGINAIFQAFDQLEEANTRENRGTGLGLALTQKLVELHNGALDVESELGKGSTFYFTLPLANKNDLRNPIIMERESSNPESDSCHLPLDIPSIRSKFDSIPSPHATSSTKHTEKENEEAREKILIVDDDTINRIVLRGILEIDNYEVIEADSGANALKLVSENSDISLIVLDIMMPQMDGYEVCRRLRIDHTMHRLPIVFLTAKTSEEAFEDGMEAGGNDFLTKPTSKNILLPKISSLLRMAHET